MRGSTLGLALLAAWPAVAHAGGLNDSFDIIHLRPFVGYELSHVGTIEARVQNRTALQTGAFDPNRVVKTDAYNTSSLAWGAYLGFRLGPISLDALFQRADLGQTGSGSGVTTHKLYADLGLNIGSGWIRSVVDIGFGYSFLDIEGAPRSQGFGGRVGVSLDFFPTKWISLGPTASFDAQGYVVDNGVIGAYGGTFAGRVGFHL